MSEHDRQPWDQHPEESNAAYSAFLAYRDMGRNRTVVDAYRQTKCKPDASQAGGEWNAWSRDQRWQERARAWDDHMDDVRQAELEAAERDRARVWAGRRDEHNEATWDRGRQIL